MEVEATPDNPLILNFGQEYAHQKCLSTEKSDPDKVSAVIQAAKKWRRVSASRPNPVTMPISAALAGAVDALNAAEWRRDTTGHLCAKCPGGEVQIGRAFDPEVTSRILRAHSALLALPGIVDALNEASDELHRYNFGDGHVAPVGCEKRVNEALAKAEKLLEATK
jgi:hypothetical protein